MNRPKYFALIPAAGVGSRLGAATPKQYLSLAGKPMLRHAVEAFLGSEKVERVFVVVSAGDGYVEDALKGTGENQGRVAILRHGGDTRQQSVLNGLNAIGGEVGGEDWILVHDAARPGLTPGMIEDLLHAVGNDPTGGLLAMPVVDTLKREGDGGRVQATVPRSGLWAAQTPQMFRYALLKHALTAVKDVTDEASAIEALGLQPLLVEGNARNFKVTLPQDVALAELFLKASS